MLIWINGPFGGGKTQTAYELLRRVPGSVVCDPEHVGFGLHRMLPPELRGDFQDLPVWRTAVHQVLARTLAERPGPVIVPMTVVEPAYFRETVGRLRADGHEVHHFALLAERATVMRRLRERGLGRVLRRAAGKDAPPRRETFAVRRLDLCLERLAGPDFAEQVWTDRITVPQVAERLAASAGLDIAPDTDGALRGRLRRAGVGLRHVRFD
ncbi:putative TmrB-like protein [Actinacidiphila reveromycinica]|uniref:Putative TmrB-like protein n=1 Tax=Actinacidiphila reveromycinica TaxID=659352 RepID=A0A7U3UTS7_9ACTN|nr:AAA family ATPase [Streptomyces sp. SN-593]BBA98603.1 putative TmrB-like protein [Streptomyces sp. SN-593]